MLTILGKFGMTLNRLSHIIRINPVKIGYTYILLIVLSVNFSFAQVKNEAELKKQADKDFENEDYNLAYKLYAQLVSLYPRDPEYNYRLGVCMLYTEPDKKKPFSYLKIATSNTKDAPKEAKFYLAKTYHMNYQFDEAIKLYNEYKQIGSSSSIKKLQVDREIESCKNGKRLLSNLSDLVVMSKKQLSEADYFRSYDTKDIGGKLLVKPDDFRSFMDKRKKEKSVIYLPRNGERVYYSSYGETGDKGRDIYFVNKLPNGDWSKPQAMPSSINTDYDEDYPFLHPNGKTLYFSSKGHNSMGGYDVFKTTYNSSTQTWSKPVNLEFPINSPDDDILFVTDSLEKHAFFSTGRYSPYGKLDVLKISTERRPMDFAFLKGTVVKEEVTQSLKSKITVKNMANGEIVGTYQAQDNGDYVMDVPNGGKFLFTVETPGLPTQSEGVQIPIAYSLKPYKQLISYDHKKLKIINYFDGQIADENYSVMIDLIEKKAKLEVNENEPYNNALKNQSGIIDENANLNAVNTTKPNIVEDNGTPKNNTNKNVTNEQLLSIAKTDAKEAGDEAKKLKQEAQEAFGLATQKTAEAVDLEKKADAELITANSIKDLTKKNSEVEKANTLKDEAKIATDVANTATNMAKKLEVDANLKQKESDLTNQYITELEAITKNKNNKEALTKLEKIQKELDDLSKQKNQSDELFESLKAESVLKQTELTNSENKTNEIVRDINNIKNENKTLETDLANETDKSIKENISAQIRELNNDIDIKNKDLEVNNSKIDKLKNELEGINKEIEVAAKILNEKTDVIVSNKNVGNDITEGAVITNTVSNSLNSNPSKITYNELTQKYTDILIPSASSKEDLNKQNSNLKNYNSEIGNLIDLDKTAINNSRDSKEKKRLNEEIKNLEKLKSENDKAIISNSNKVKELDAIAITNTTVSPSDNANAISPAINLLNEADALNNKAFEERKEAKTKTGIEKDNLIKQAVENEKLAIDKKLEASDIIEKENKTSFEKNLIDIANLNKLSEGKTSDAIAQAKKLESESQLNFKQAEKLRSEADRNNSTAAKLGGYSNAEEKEAEAIAKQEKSLELLIKENPTYTKQGQAIVNINNGLENPNNVAISTNSNSATTNTNAIVNNSGQQTSGIGDEASKLKSGLNSSAENNLKTFNSYSNTEAISIKDQAISKINDALNQDKQIANQLDNISELSKNTTTVNEVSLQSISDLTSEADKLNDEAFKFRQSAKSKTGDEKEKDLASAKKLETDAVSKKISAASAQENYNSKLFNGNKESLNDLQQLAKGKNLQELNNADAQIKEINLLFDKAKSLRQEAKGYLTDAAKLGGIGNAEEKENAALAKQDDLIKVFKKNFPNYEVKQTNSGSGNNNITNKLNDTKNNLNTNNQKHIDGLVLLASANEKEFKSRMLTLGTNLTADQTVLKNNAQAAYKLSKEQLLKANETTDPFAKKELLVDANKNGQQSVNLLSQISANTVITTNTAVVTNTSSVVTNTNAVVANTPTVSNTSIKTNTIASVKTATSAITTASTSTTATTTILTNTTPVVSTNTAIVNSTNTNSVASNSTGTVNPNNLKTSNNTGDGTSILKSGLNNASENKLKTFNAYTNSEAISLKEQALVKIIAALDKDKLINNQLTEIDELEKKNTSSETINKQSIIDLTTEAEKLNDEAFKLRQSAITKTGDEKAKDLSSAKQLESEAVFKKISAAKQQQQFNSATYEANQKSLEDLKQMAQGKNISELETADMQMNEADLFFSKAKTLREEANAYPTDAAKLGGYGNAEEKENTAIAKQEALLNTYKKYFSNYVLKQPIIKTENLEVTNKLNEAQKTIEENNFAHNDGLTTLSQANDKEYNSRVLSLPANLTANQISLKSKAQVAFEKSKSLVAKANQTSNALTKKEILIEANQNGQESINFLNQIIGNAPIANVATPTINNANPVANNTLTVTSNSATKNNTITPIDNSASNTNISKNNNASTNSTDANSSVKLKVEGLDVKNGNAYTANKPIPIDEKIQDGLVFKVQIGAFKQPLPNGTFKGLTPVIAQTTPSGYLRYMAGNFEKYESANAVKNDLKNLGYSDAFVVAYYNGVRVNLNEGVEKAKAAGQIVSVNNNTSAGLTTNNNVPKNSTAQPIKAISDNSPVEITNELEKINGLLYTVQIGVYSKEVTRSQLSNLKPIFTEKLPSGLYRYTAGIYNQSVKLLDDKQKVIGLGVKDAFVSAYYNAKRIPFAEGKKLQLENQNVKMEVENPIIFPNGSNTVQPILNAVAPTTNTATNAVSSPSVSPFNNGVTTGPTPTAENGVKTDDSGISYKVQIGAYKNQVPNDVAAKFLNIKTWPVNNVVLNGLFIYTIGNFNGVSFAKKLKDEAISVGISDAFITVYKDGKKLYGSEATTYLSK